MENLGYIIDGNRAAELISSNIYNPISSIVETISNYYDADGTESKIDFIENDDSDGKNYIKEIIITGDGEGFGIDDLNNLREIGNSKKRENMYTNRFKRVRLGSFGIAFTSFQNLGDEIEIYSKIKSGKILHTNIIVKNKLTIFKEVKELDYCDLIKYETGCAFIIKNCKVPKSVFMNFDLLKNKLAYLPLSDNFKIYLCGEEIKRIVIDDESFYKQTFNFTIKNIQFNGKVYYSPETLKNIFFKGVYLQIDGRIIDWNIFNDIRQGITTAGSVENRIQGYIIANELRNKINASRTGLTDNNLSLNISEILKKNIRQIRNKATKYYGWEKPNKKHSRKKENSNSNEINSIKQFTKEETSLKVAGFDRKVITVEPKEIYTKSHRIEKAQKRLKNPNKDLKRLGIKFCYEPESEIEVIIIASQMWQKDLLDFDIMQVVSSEYPDSIVIKDGELAFLEFEQKLNSFYEQIHNHTKIDYILCWDINEKGIDKKSEVYLDKYSGYIESIQHEKATNNSYYDKIIVNNCDGSKHIIKLYILSEIIKKLKK